MRSLEFDPSAFEDPTWRVKHDRKTAGTINERQVHNVALAVKERRELDREEKAEVERVMDRAVANLPAGYEWLRNWRYV